MAGTYTEITEIVAPSSAAEGETVDVTIKIKNTWTDYVHVAAIGVWDTEERFIDWLKYLIPAGETHSFSGSFVMPDTDVTIHAYSAWEDTDGYWHLDDEAEKDVAMAEVFEGTISGMELEYDEARANIPAYDIPQGQSGLIHIWGRNDMTTTQRLGIHWAVYDPDLLLVEDYEDWSLFGAAPGVEHEFIGGRFDINKIGNWQIVVNLLMNPASPVVVDIYDGTLCTVAAVVPEPEFQGFALAEYIKV